MVSRLRLQLLSAAIFLLAWTQSSALEPRREAGILPIDPPTPNVHYSAVDSPHGRVLVVHGLDVSKETMHVISTALADKELDVYAIDLPGHGDSTAKFQTELAQHAILNAKTYLGDNTMSTTILDRLMHHCQLLEFDGRSYRLKEASETLARKSKTS